MNRTRCPRCNTRLDNNLLIACSEPTCGVVFAQYERSQLELLERHKELLSNEIVERAKHHLDHLKQEKNDLIAEVSQRTRSRLRWEVIAGISLFLTVAGFGIWQAYKEAVQVLSARMLNQIATRFAEQNIQETLNTVAQTHANKIIEDRISPAIEDAQRRIEQARQSLESSVTETKARFDAVLRELQQANEFIMAVVAAQGDDRKAFDKLKIWADDKSHPFSSLAERVWWNILQDRGGRLRGGYFTLDWREGIEPSKFSLEELRQAYKTIRIHLKPALIEFIWNRNDITKKDRMQFLVDVIENDQSLTAVEWAGRFFTASAELPKNPLDVKVLVDWWKKNKDKIE